MGENICNQQMLEVRVVLPRPLVVISLTPRTSIIGVFTLKLIESVSASLLFLTDQPLFCVRTTRTGGGGKQFKQNSIAVN